MEALKSPKAAHVILEAVQLTTNAEIAALRHLVVRHADVLKLDLVLRIVLTFLPESTDPVLYVDFLHDILKSASSKSFAEDFSYEPDISDSSAKRQLRRLHLLPLADPQYVHEDSIDSFTLFLLHQAHKIDAETGSLPFVLRLIDPFIVHSEQLRTWAISTFLPLFRLKYEYYPYSRPENSLEGFETLSGNPAIDSLLSEAAKKSNETKSHLGRDLKGLVGPWIYGASTKKRRKMDSARPRASSVVQIHDKARHDTDGLAETSGGWAHVNEWLLELSLRDFPRAVEVLAQWDGPKDVDYGHWDDGRPVDRAAVQAVTEQYARAGLAVVYTANDGSLNTLEGSHRILQRVAELMDLPLPPKLTLQTPMNYKDMPLEFLDGLSKAHLLHNSMLLPRNPFTTPTDFSIRLSYLLLESNRILESLGSPMNCKTLAELGLFGNEADQMAELRKLLHRLQAKSRDREKWNTARNQILWLRKWSFGKDSSERDIKTISGVFRRINSTHLEEELLKAFLNSSCYSLAVETYCKSSPLPIPLSKVEKVVVGVALACYDGASNGNRTRGGVRKASEIATAFHNYFSKSESFSQVFALLAATHAMSFYSLTLQHGVPFQPVNIRAHKDPLSLVGKILDQNTHSYTKLDDLLEIGQNLASAGLTHSARANISNPSKETQELSGIYVKRRITAMAIEASLAEGDFDTAYSYVANRLSPPTLPSSDPKALNVSLELDDVSWRAAYEAGRYRPVKHVGPSALRRLEQRMELLSQALLLAPSSALPEILVVWRQCEEEMTLLIAREVEEEERWDDKGDRRLPGTFSGDTSPIIQKAREPNRAALNEEAPMGLFDVARGAAAALSKNAFPLRSARNSGAATPLRASHDRGLSLASGGGSESGPSSGPDSEGRLRKRDMVSNMVTGGLASGIGWVIGAPSVRQE